MYCVYAIQSLKNNRLYIGYSNNLKKRLRDHNSKNGGQFTSKNAPFKLIYAECFISKKDAILQEKFYKTGYGREVLQGKLTNSL